MKKLTILLPLFLTACGTTSLTVTNPVIDADAPDPTVIRVGDTYYAAATSGNSRQAYARYKSDDLRTWQKTATSLTNGLSGQAVPSGHLSSLL